MAQHDWRFSWATGLTKCAACGMKQGNETAGLPCYPSAPKPATVEPPPWKGWPHPLEAGQEFLLDGKRMVVTEVAQSAPGTPEEIIDRVTEAIATFDARDVPEIARAMQEPVTFTARLGGRT